MSLNKCNLSRLLARYFARFSNWRQQLATPDPDYGFLITDSYNSRIKIYFGFGTQFNISWRAPLPRERNEYFAGAIVINTHYLISYDKLPMSNPILLALWTIGILIFPLSSKVPQSTKLYSLYRLYSLYNLSESHNSWDLPSSCRLFLYGLVMSVTD